MILGPADVVDLTEVIGHTPNAVRLDAAHVPGTVIVASGDRLVIAAGQGAIAPRTLQLAGKRPMSIADVLRGHTIQPGERFGPE